MNKKILAILPIVAASFLLLFYVSCFNHVSVNSVGVAYNSLNGNLSLQPHPGWYVTSPLTRVVNLDMLPHRIELPSPAKVVTAKMVRLNPTNVLEFVRYQGFSYDLNISQYSIMMGYAFSTDDHNFIEVVAEARNK
jgi:hypothetical protein